MLSAFDRAQFLRASGYTVLSLGLAAAVTVLTDEATSTASTRFARLLALVPAAVVLGSWAAAAQARARGEARALLALGAHALRPAWGGVLAGWLIGGGALVALKSPNADVRALFPAAAVGTRWELQEGRLAAPDLGVAVSVDGAIRRSPRTSLPSTRPGPGATAAMVLLTPLTVVGPVWAVLPMSLLGRLSGLALSVAPILALFHALAVGGNLAAGGVLAALPMLAQTAWALQRAGRVPPVA